MLFSVVEDISKVRQPLPNFEAIYILTPEETVSHKIHNMYMCQLKRPTHCYLNICFKNLQCTCTSRYLCLEFVLSLNCLLGRGQRKQVFELALQTSCNLIYAQDIPNIIAPAAELILLTT